MSRRPLVAFFGILLCAVVLGVSWHLSVETEAIFAFGWLLVAPLYALLLHLFARTMRRRWLRAVDRAVESGDPAIPPTGAFLSWYFETDRLFGAVGKRLADRGRIREAGEYYRRAARTEPAYAREAYALYRKVQPRPDAWPELVRAAARAGERSLELTLDLSQVVADAGEPEEAIELLEAALTRSEPEDFGPRAELALRLAQLEAHRRRFSAADAYVEMAEKTLPCTDPAVRALYDRTRSQLSAARGRSAGPGPLQLVSR